MAGCSLSSESQNSRGGNNGTTPNIMKDKARPSPSPRLLTRKRELRYYSLSSQSLYTSLIVLLNGAHTPSANAIRDIGKLPTIVAQRVTSLVAVSRSLTPKILRSSPPSPGFSSMIIGHHKTSAIKHTKPYPLPQKNKIK